MLSGCGHTLRHSHLRDAVRSVARLFLVSNHKFPKVLYFGMYAPTPCLCKRQIRQHPVFWATRPGNALVIDPIAGYHGP